MTDNRTWRAGKKTRLDMGWLYGTFFRARTERSASLASGLLPCCPRPGRIRLTPPAHFTRWVLPRLSCCLLICACFAARWMPVYECYEDFAVNYIFIFFTFTVFSSFHRQHLPCDCLKTAYFRLFLVLEVLSKKSFFARQHSTTSYPPRTTDKIGSTCLTNRQKHAKINPIGNTGRVFHSHSGVAYLIRGRR